MPERRCARGAALAAVAALSLAACATAPPTATMAATVASDCDRACLAGMITTYVDALVAHDPSRLPLSADARFTENSQDLALGAGLWETVTAEGGFRQDYLDTERRIAAAHVLVMEGDDPALLSVALRVEGETITGVETLVQHITPDSRFQPVMLGRPLAVMNDPIPEGARLSRAAAVRTALTYTEGLRIGTFIDTTPFGADAYRIENGVFMAGAGCPREECPDIQTQDIIEHPDVVASVAAVDEENGAVLLWMNFGDTGNYGPGNALVTFEAFKVWGGEIHAVNAFFAFLPATTERGWPSTDPPPAP